MNYIKQLNAVMFQVAEDDRLNPTHVSLYLALFQLWNLNRFNNPISINRAEVMKISKIGSKGTYHKCIKDLHNWSYFEYKPSFNPLKGSKIYMFNFETGTEQVIDLYRVPKSGQVLGQVVVPSINNTNITKSKHLKLEAPPKIDEIKDFFNTLSSDKKENEFEAERFFNYYTSNGWKVGGKSPMKSWQASARNWMLNAQKKANEKPVVQNRDFSNKNYLNTKQIKNYNEPL